MPLPPLLFGRFWPYTEDSMATSARDRPIDMVIQQLKQLLGGRESNAESVCENHSHGESYHRAAAPDVVCLPHTTEEVQAIVAISAAHRVPIVPFGAGTSLEGHVHALRGGICIDLRELNKIGRLDSDDLDA